jgi:hypothetical protein
MFGAATHRGGEPLRDLRPGERVHVTVRAENPLAPNHYYVGFAMTTGSSGGDILDYRAGAADFIVYGSHDPGGLVSVQHELSIERRRDGS